MMIFYDPVIVDKWIVHKTPLRSTSSIILIINLDQCILNFLIMRYSVSLMKENAAAALSERDFGTYPSLEVIMTVISL